MSELSTVSVVIPLHDGERFLAAAIESVLAQKGAQIEAIVVDDGSRDRGPDIARSYPVRLLSQPRRGVAAARNRGVRAARGEFVGFLDQDDEWIPGKVAQQVAYLRSHPGVDVVMGHVEQVFEPGADVPEWSKVKLPAGVTHFPSCMLGPILARRSTFERAGEFDESYAAGSDSDWLNRVREVGEMHVLAEPVLRYRLHDANASRDYELMRAEGLRVLFESVRRKRAAESAGKAT